MGGGQLLCHSRSYGMRRIIPRVPDTDRASFTEDNASGHAQIRTFLIADIRGYTLFTQEHGDEAAARLAAKFADIAREIVERRGGTLLELRGDEALCVFVSTREAIRAAIDLQQRFVEETLEQPEFPLTVGIGLDAGEAVPVQGGYRGAALNLAARLCGQARAGEILATREVTHLARRIEGAHYENGGSLAFKGLSEPVVVVRVVPEGADPVERLRPFAKTPRTTPRIYRRWVIPAGVAAVLALVAISIPLLGSDDGDPATRNWPPPNSAIEIDPNTMGIVATVPDMPQGCAATQVAAGEGNVWWLAGSTLTRIDEETRQARTPIPLPTNGCNYPSLAVGFRTVWVASRVGLQPVDPANGELLREIKLEIPKAAQESNIPQFFTNDVAVGAGKIWATSGVGYGLAEVDPLSGDSLVRPLEGDADAVAFGEDAVWVIDSLDSTVSKLDPRSGEAVDQRVMDGNVDAIAVGEGAVWILDSNAGGVTSLDPMTLNSTGTIRVGSNPTDIAAGLGAVWVSNEGDGTVSRVDAETHQVDMVNVRRPVTSIVADDATDTVWSAIATLHE
jgi:class 3 adenylate cyclase/streptogramin lyase